MHRCDADLADRRLRVRTAFPEGRWEVRREKDSDFGLGVSPLDAAYVLQPVAHLRQLDATQQLACDVTRRRTTQCARRRPHPPVQRRHDHAPAGGRHACGSDWTFVPDPTPCSSSRSSIRSSPAAAAAAGKIMLDDLRDEAEDQNFRAILFGDCTGNWQTSRARGWWRQRAPRLRAVRLGRAEGRSTAWRGCPSTCAPRHVQRPRSAGDATTRRG